MRKNYPNKETMRIIEVEYHRNGIGGRGFFVIRFFYTEDGETERYIATIFPSNDKEGNETNKFTGECCILQEPKYGSINISSCWRGDHFEQELRNFLVWREKSYSFEKDNSGYAPIGDYYKPDVVTI